MAGSHRDAEAKVRTLGPASMAGLVLAVVAVIGFGVWAVDGIFGGQDPAAGPTAGASPSATPTGSPSGTPSTPSPTSPAPSASATTTPDADLPVIAEASPRRLRAGDLIDAGFDAAITPDAGRLTASSASDLSRLSDRGRPASPGTDTVVVIGEDRFDRQAALNRIGDLKPGDTIGLETYNADLTYTIDRSFKIDASTVSTDATVTARVPGQLVLVATTYDRNGNRANQDTVVVARLTGAQAR